MWVNSSTLALEHVSSLVSNPGWPADAKPSQVCRFPAQHQPTFGALRLAVPSRPVPLLNHYAGVRRVEAAVRFATPGPDCHETVPALQHRGLLQEPVQTLG